MIVLQEQTSYNLADLDDIKENVAYGTALHELIRTKDNKAYIKTEQIQFVENQAYMVRQIMKGFN